MKQSGPRSIGNSLKMCVMFSVRKCFFSRVGILSEVKLFSNTGQRALQFLGNVTSCNLFTILNLIERKKEGLVREHLFIAATMEEITGVGGMRGMVA